ncbi:MAG: hypothetical protein GXO36_06685, partial [Chloroflexi bacterium]|nr:hypothetical protein [Chloroflexota bacterium]
RVFRTRTWQQQRKQLMQMLAQTVRALIQHHQVDEEAWDMAAFLALTLQEIARTVEHTVQPWEKRDYWVKADRFRRDWAWAADVAAGLDQALADQVWDQVLHHTARLFPRIAATRLPKRPRWGARPWTGAYTHWQQRRRPPSAPEQPAT